MLVTNKSDPDYSHQNTNNITTRYVPVNWTNKSNVSVQTEQEPNCQNGCLSMYIDTRHVQETDHSDSRVTIEKRLNGVENLPSLPKEVHSDDVQRDGSGCTSNSFDSTGITGIQEYALTESYANTGTYYGISAASREPNVGINTELAGYGQSHTVDIDKRGVICLQLASDGEQCIVEKTYFCVDPADTRRKDNDNQDAHLVNPKQQPTNSPPPNVLSAREEVNEMSERILTYLKPYKCNYCAKGFARQFNLKVHERIHTGVKPYTCIYCNKAFSRQGKLTEHERTHTGVKPYKCTICDKLFAAESNLKVHERVHTGVKPYKCTTCEKEFTVKCSLKKHERLHTGVRPYECIYCGKTFTVKYSLKEHESIHTGIKPFKCTYCDKAFVRQIRLRKHERIHTGVKPSMCA